MADSWTDPLYRPPGTPERAHRRTLAGVEVSITVTDCDPDTVEAMWRPDREVELTVPDTLDGAALTAVLRSFLEHASTLADRPTEAHLTLPSRDVDRARLTREAGLLPGTVLAVADLSRRPSGADSEAAAGWVIREARADDAQAFADLWWEQTAYESRLGSLRATPAIRAAADAAAPGHLSGGRTVLVATEADGTPVAAVDAQSPQDSRWAGASTVLEPASYLAMASTAPKCRGRGLAGALIAELHRRHRQAGIAASLLHYSVHNPLSVPFWSQQGYRPLLTSFTRSVSAP